MKILVGSKNKHKVNAVVQAVDDLGLSYDVIGVESESGVADKPVGDDMTLTGAKNRAQFVRELDPDAEYTVGLESGFKTVLGETFVTNWCTITNINNQGVSVAGISFLMPEASGVNGYIGVISNNELTRQDIIFSLVRDAFILMRSKEHDEN